MFVVHDIISKLDNILYAFKYKFTGGKNMFLYGYQNWAVSKQTAHWQFLRNFDRHLAIYVRMKFGELMESILNLMESIPSSFISVTVPVFVKTQLHTNVQMLWMQTTWYNFASRPIGEVYLACIIRWYYVGTVGLMSLTWTIVTSLTRHSTCIGKCGMGIFLNGTFTEVFSWGIVSWFFSTKVIQVVRCGCEVILCSTEDVWFVVGETISYLVVTVIHELLGILFHVSWICCICNAYLHWEDE